jgi:hypothetical protein
VRIGGWMGTFIGALAAQAIATPPPTLASGWLSMDAPPVQFGGSSVWIPRAQRGSYRQARREAEAARRRRNHRRVR